MGEVRGIDMFVLQFDLVDIKQFRRRDFWTYTK